MKREETYPPLSSIPGFSESSVASLSRHGIGSVAEFLSVCHIHECHVGLRKLLGITEEELDGLIATAQGVLPEDARDMSPTPISVGKLGCSLEEDDGIKWDFGKDSDQWSRFQVEKHGGLPKSVSLIDRLQGIRNQGSRGTCVAFAMVALREFALKRNRALSEQFLYWDCKQKDGHAGPGTYISTGVECISHDGVCKAKIWPYVPSRTGDEGQGPPPRGASRNAAKYRASGFSALRVDIRELKACLAYGTKGCGLPILFAVPVFPSWGNAETSRTGKVFMPFENEQAIGGHALCLAGYTENESIPGGGYFIFRNSWGVAWARESPVSAGYGMLPYAYMQKYGRSCITLTKHARMVSSSLQRIHHSVSLGGGHNMTRSGQKFKSPKVYRRVPVVIGAVLACILFACFPLRDFKYASFVRVTLANEDHCYEYNAPARCLSSEQVIAADRSSKGSSALYPLRLFRIRVRRIWARIMDALGILEEG